MSIYFVFGIIFWLYLLSVLKRAKLPAYYFIVGIVGLFFFLFFLSKPYFIWVMVQAIMKGVMLIAAPFHMVEAYTDVGIFQITHGIQSVSLSIDYECSGVIETAAFWALIVFFPIYSVKQKVLWGIVGLGWIYIANVIRLLIIVSIVHFFGVKWFFLAHSILGRLFFYVLVVYFYYRVFTYGQLATILEKE